MSTFPPFLATIEALKSMTQTFLTDIDLRSNKVRNICLEAFDVAPSNLASGRFFLINDAQGVKVPHYYDGSALVPFYGALANSTQAGRLSAADKTKLDAVTAAATANTIVLRDGSGNTALNGLTAALATITSLTATSLSSTNATISALTGISATLSGGITAATLSLSGLLSAASAQVTGDASVGGDLSVTGDVDADHVVAATSMTAPLFIGNLQGTADSVTTLPTVTGDLFNAGNELRIIDGSITADKMAADAITADSIADGSITNVKLANASVNADPNTIALRDSNGDSKFRDLTVKTVNGLQSSSGYGGSSGPKIVSFNSSLLTNLLDPVSNQDAATKNYVDTAIAGVTITDGSITTEKLANGSVTTEKLANDSVTDAKIVDGTITLSKLAVSAVSASTPSTLVSRDTNGDSSFHQLNVDSLAPDANDGFITLNSNRLTGLALPTASTDAVRKDWVEDAITDAAMAAAAGLIFKDPVRAKSTAAIASPLTGVPAAASFDGVTIVAGDAVLLDQQADATQNGLWVVSAGAWARRADADSAVGNEVRTGLYALVLEGPNYGSTGWVLTTTGAITVGTTSLTFVQARGKAEVNGVNGLENVGINLGIANAGVSTAKLVDSSVTTAKLAPGAVTDAKITDGTITNAKLASASTEPDVSTVALRNSSGNLKAESFIGTTATLATSLTIDTVILANYPRIDGGEPVRALSIGNSFLADVLTPFYGTDGANKSYVDDAVAAVAVADGGITTAKLGDDSVTTAKIVDGSITNVKLANASVNADPNTIALRDSNGDSKFRDLTVKTVNGLQSSSGYGGSSGPKIVSFNSSLLTNLLDPVSNQDAATKNYVDTAIAGVTITDGSITTEKLANGSVTTEKLANDSVTTEKIVDDSITAVKIVDGTITTAKIANGAIGEPQLASDAVSTSKVQDGAITSVKLADGSVGTTQLATGAVTNPKITDGTIALAKLAVAATNAATPSTLVLRDASGNANFATVNAGVVVASADMSSGTFTASISVLTRSLAVDNIVANTFGGAISFSNTRVTGIAIPSQNTDAVNKQYVDSVAQGLDLKQPCRVAATANITLSGLQTIDDIAVTAGDRVFAVAQTDNTKNGIWIADAGDWVRSSDANLNTNVSRGLYAFVLAGTANAGSAWVLSSPDPITVSVSALTFVQFSGAQNLIAGNGMTRSGNTFNVGGTAGRIAVNADTIDIDANYPGQPSIVSVGTIANAEAIWQGQAVGLLYGGTGAATAAGARANLGVPGIYTELIGDGVADTFVVNHDRNSLAVTVEVWSKTAPYAAVEVEKRRTDADNITLYFNVPPATDAYEVVIHA